MKVRRQGGATLGLTAACVLLVIVIGVGFYFLSKMIGGGREVANATDAGAINVAKQALKRGTVTLSVAQAAEFGNLCDPNTPGVITLITYNRVLAQAMMVAQNAAVEATPTAATNAQNTLNMAQNIGLQLKQSLNNAAGTNGTLPGDFNALSGQSNTKMWNGNPVACSKIATGYLKDGGSTNIIFDTATVAALAGNSGWTGPKLLTTGPSANNLPNTKDSLGNVVGPGGHYMPGYVYNLIGGLTMTGVPVFPNTKPHLVDIGTFATDQAASAAQGFVADTYTAPNGFQSNGQATESKSGNVAGTVACAVVGVLNADYKASFPMGFLRISNGPDALTANGGSFPNPIVSNGDFDIFNNQLYTPPNSSANGITQDPSGVFTTNASDLTAWSNFNNRNNPYNSLAANPLPANVQAAVTAASYTGTKAWVAFNVKSAGTIYPPNTPVPQADLPTFADGNIVGGSPQSIADMAANPSNYDSNEGGLRDGGSCSAPYATLAELEQIGVTSGTTINCNYTMYDQGMSTAAGTCGDPNVVGAWQTNYMCGMPGASSGALATSGANQGVTNVEYLKAALLTKISGRLGGSYCSDVSIPNAQPSGVKYFSQGVPGSSTGLGGSAVAFDPGATNLPGGVAAPVNGGASLNVNFEVVGSPYDYLSQISGIGSATSDAGNGNPGQCAGIQNTSNANSIIDLMTKRMQQIDSTVQNSAVTNILKTQQLHVANAFGTGTTDNGTLYLYVKPSTHTLTLAPKSQFISDGYTDSTSTNTAFPDGPAPATDKGTCYDQYPLNGWVVDTQYTMTGDLKGDAHYHDQPFTEPGTVNPAPPSFDSGGLMGNSPNVAGPTPIYGQDQAIFKPSSGAQNLLGELKFQENTQGTTFCKPN